MLCSKVQQVLYNQGTVHLAGDIWLLQREPHPQFPTYQIIELPHGNYLKTRVGKQSLVSKLATLSIAPMNIFKSAL